MIEKKTGAMLGLCMEIPALLANQDEGVCNQLRKFGYDIGKGFQIQDDILEIFSGVEAMGKSLGSDVITNKQTALTLMARKLVPQDWNKFCKRQGSQTINEKLCAVRKTLKNWPGYEPSLKIMVSMQKQRQWRTSISKMLLMRWQ